MTLNLCMLVGIARPIPDVLSFVTPVFSDGNGQYYLQEVKDHHVTGFSPVVIGEEFVELDSRLALKVNDPCLYGFEYDDGSYVLASAWMLAAAFRTILEADVKSKRLTERTKSAVARFCTSLQHVSPPSEEKILPPIYLFSSPATENQASKPVDLTRLFYKEIHGGRRATDAWEIRYQKPLYVGEASGSYPYYVMEINNYTDEDHIWDSKTKGPQRLPNTVVELKRLVDNSYNVWSSFEQLNQAYTTLLLWDSRFHEMEIVNDASRIHVEFAKASTAQITEAANQMISLLEQRTIESHYEHRQELNELRTAIYDAYRKALESLDATRKNVSAIEYRLLSGST